ncbi:hypothetical protein D3C72_1333920 [compost metagenome]
MILCFFYFRDRQIFFCYESLGSCIFKLAVCQLYFIKFFVQECLLCIDCCSLYIFKAQVSKHAPVISIYSIAMFYEILITFLTNRQDSYIFLGIFISDQLFRCLNYVCIICTTGTSVRSNNDNQYALD